MSARLRHLSPRTGAALVAVVVSLVMGVQASAGAAPLPTRKAWLADTVRAMKGSQAYVRQRVDAQQKGQKLAINLDIDNTSIQSHYAYPKAVPVTQRFARYATKHGVTLFFNTGRYADQLGAISKVLTKAGYDYTRICGRQHGESLTHSKQRCRAQFYADGYTIIANVGNRATDFVGGDYEKGFRLPGYAGKLS
ncbi:HAD family acid phosphatase [Nocardioides mangrovicus]|nr:HAD family acid phosphatase [Nocardioides mangrovicus]